MKRRRHGEEKSLLVKKIATSTRGKNLGSTKVLTANDSEKGTRTGWLYTQRDLYDSPGGLPSGSSPIPIRGKPELSILIFSGKGRQRLKAQTELTNTFLA